jgi:hypothetical protein
MKGFWLNCTMVFVFGVFVTGLTARAEKEIEETPPPVVCANNAVPDDCSVATKGKRCTNKNGEISTCWWDNSVIPAACVCP